MTGSEISDIKMYWTTLFRWDVNIIFNISHFKNLDCRFRQLNNNHGNTIL